MLIIGHYNDNDDDIIQVGHECDIFTLVFSPSGQFLLTGGQDGFCRYVYLCEALLVLVS